VRTGLTAGLPPLTRVPPRRTRHSFRRPQLAHPSRQPRKGEGQFLRDAGPPGRRGRCCRRVQGCAPASHRVRAAARFHACTRRPNTQPPWSEAVQMGHSVPPAQSPHPAGNPQAQHPHPRSPTRPRVAGACPGMSPAMPPSHGGSQAFVFHQKAVEDFRSKVLVPFFVNYAKSKGRTLDAVRGAHPHRDPHPPTRSCPAPPRLDPQARIRSHPTSAAPPQPPGRPRLRRRSSRCRPSSWAPPSSTWSPQTACPSGRSRSTPKKATPLPPSRCRSPPQAANEQAAAPTAARPAVRAQQAGATCGDESACQAP
jgi:hypothetical protein